MVLHSGAGWGGKGELGPWVSWGGGSDKCAFPATKNMTLILCARACVDACVCILAGRLTGTVLAVTPWWENMSPELAAPAFSAKA